MTTQSSAHAAPPLPLIALLGLCTLAPLSGLAISGMAPVMPMIGKEFAGTPGADMLVRLMMSGLSAAMIVGALLSGMLASRVGQMRLLMVALVLYALSGSAIFFLDNLHVMVACRMIQGVANAAAGVLVMALITTRVPPHLRDKWLGFFTVSGTFGVLLLFGAVGALAAEGWRYTFLLFLIALPVALLIFLTLPAESQEERAATAAARAVPKSIPWTLTLFGVLAGGITTSISMYMPYHLHNLGLGAPETLAMLMIGGAAMAGVSSLSFGWIRKRFSAHHVFFGGFGMAGLGIALLASSSSLPLAAAGMMIQGFGLGALMPNIFSAAAAATPADRRAHMLGFVRAGFYTGPLLLQPVLELVSVRAGEQGALFAIALACVAGGAFPFLFRRAFDPVQENIAVRH